MKPKRFYGKGIPKLDPSQLSGTLIVIEGSDGAGRSTQIQLLSNWLEKLGYPVVVVGLKRSELAGEALAHAMQGTTLNTMTMSLFYATDFADQLERVIVPALKASFIVLADRYIYTLMARDIVRGASSDWLKSIYDIALVPDAVFYLKVSPKLLAERNFQKRGGLDYWESGMDIQRTGDRYDNFIKYQTKLHRVFDHLKKEHAFYTIQGHRTPIAIAKEIRTKIEKIISGESLESPAKSLVPPPTLPEPASPSTLGE
jgi:dTMP kinase